MARAASALVLALSSDGRDAEAAEQALHLADFFAERRAELHPIAAHTFGGLYSAARAGDADEVGDFLALIDEMFPAS